MTDDGEATRSGKSEPCLVKPWTWRRTRQAAQRVGSGVYVADWGDSATSTLARRRRWWKPWTWFRRKQSTYVGSHAYTEYGSYTIEVTTEDRTR